MRSSNKPMKITDVNLQIQNPVLNEHWYYVKKEYIHGVIKCLSLFFSNFKIYVNKSSMCSAFVCLTVRLVFTIILK